MMIRKNTKYVAKMKVIVATTTLVVLLLALAVTTIGSEHYLLSCGAPSSVSKAPSTYDGQTWHTDKNSSFSSSFSSTTTTTSTSFNVERIPFWTARVFSSNFTYSFPVSPGPVFLRLFFSPSDTDTDSDSFLTVTSNSGHLLLHNFSSTPGLFKEFYLHVSTPSLQLTFSPTPPSKRASLNGIEVVSVVPDSLYAGPTPTNVAQPGVDFDVTNSTAFETAYRLNVGGTEVGPTRDSGGMFRRWSPDQEYVTPPFLGSTGLHGNRRIADTASAPGAVYETFRWMGKVSDEVKSGVNVTWGFQVDLGFHYLLRLHWCEVTLDNNASNYRVFDVYIHGMLAERGADVFQWVGADTPVYRDYVVYMAGDGTGLLQLAMHPNTQQQTMYEDILLNGLEILKVSRANGSLNAPNPATTSPSSNPQPPSTLPPKSSSHIIFVIVGSLIGATLLASILYYLIRRKNSKSTPGAYSSSTNKTKTESASPLPSDLCRRFSITEIKLATSDFSDSLIIGRGGFGNVYKGTIDMIGAAVAIKRLNPLSKQGAREFATEIDLLSKLRHVNLVSLVGFCNDHGEMILVYDYMPRGTLKDHVIQGRTQDSNPAYVTEVNLPWLTRLQACLGAARGLHYLHSEAGHMIIHRDVKSTNILLDEKWVAKVADFGLSKLGPTGTDLSHVSTAVKGSFGYVDPEYYRRQQLTEKSDVYSFGVVLFEVVCGRAAVAMGLPREQVNVAMWGRRNHVSGTLGDIVDPSIKAEIAPECLRKFGEVAESCVREQGVERPSMADVVWGLEFALQLQNEATENGDGGWSSSTTVPRSITPPSAELQDSSAAYGISSTSATDSGDGMISKSSGWMFSGVTDEGHSRSTAVFSQILKPEGR